VHAGNIRVFANDADMWFVFDENIDEYDHKDAHS